MSCISLSVSFWFKSFVVYIYIYPLLYLLSLYTPLINELNYYENKHQNFTEIISNVSLFDFSCMAIKLLLNLDFKINPKFCPFPSPSERPTKLNQFPEVPQIWGPLLLSELLQSPQTWTAKSWTTEWLCRITTQTDRGKGISSWFETTSKIQHVCKLWVLMQFHLDTSHIRPINRWFLVSKAIAPCHCLQLWNKNLWGCSHSLAAVSIFFLIDI